ncbi:uncharacterized protein LOC118191516 [Stegodyphus dumicola]|uniref:uncharacterized protein LOC118191516 n=1 Tax=Stegodyphus dumicola TaxID=202533 RepID=UPI0015ACDF09|nr:uncharacterized protein LOC118191516 [Stegodyphus dumicola]
MAVGSISKLSYVPQEERFHLMPNAETFVSSCILKQPPFTETMSCGKFVLNPSCSNIVKQPSTCYTFNNLFKKPKATSRNISTSAVIEMTLFTPPHEYDPDMKMMYKTISIHSPYSLSNPFIEGILLHSEHSYKIFVKQTIKKRMKSPYDTNCFDYIEAWMKNDGTGPISESGFVINARRTETRLKKTPLCHSCIQLCRLAHQSSHHYLCCIVMGSQSNGRLDDGSRCCKRRLTIRADAGGDVNILIS